MIIESIDLIARFVKANEYFDLTGKYEINSKECNSILYLKKKIEDYSYIIEQQIVLSYALHQINDFNAIGSSIGLISGLMDIFLVGKPGDSMLQGTVDEFYRGNCKACRKIEWNH